MSTVVYRLLLIATTVVPFFPTATLAQALKGPSGQIPLPATAIPQFVQQLPLLSVQGGTIDTQLGTAPVTLQMCEFDANVLPPGTIAPGVATRTRVWGYSTNACPAGGVKDTYIGPVIVALRGQPTSVTYVNSLPTKASQSGVLAWKYSTDQTLHWADPLGDEMNSCMMKAAMMGFVDAAGNPQPYPAPSDPCAFNYDGPIPTVPHLHGGEIPAELDGSPDSWFTSDGAHRGRKFYTKGVVGEVASLPILPAPGYPAGSIVYSLADNAWFQADALGATWQPYSTNQVTYTYPNTQEAAPIWFHDHALGATRLNVYAGMAGAYYIIDPANPPVAGLPPVSDVIPLVIQDRQFDTNGQLFFQAGSNGGLLWALNPDHPYWSPEFVGDTIVVNGKAWPYANVDAKRYRFLVLNGSNARTYELFLKDQLTGAAGPSMWVIANDGGYLDTPQKLDSALGQKLVVMPGERYEILVDFAGFAGTTLVLRNSGKTPYPNGGIPPGNTLGKILQFRVNPAVVADTSYDPASLAPIRATPMVRLANAGAATVVPNKIRQLTLNEVMAMPMTAIDPVTGVLTAFPGGPMEVLVNNTKWSGENPMTMTTRTDFTPVTVKGKTTHFSEMPVEGETELWEIVNLTADAHPIHLHLVQFQVVNRQGFNASSYNAAYAAAFPALVYQPGDGPPLDYNTGNARALGGNPDIVPFLKGKAKPPSVQELGWKDTVMSLPGQVTRIMVRWAPTDTATAVPFPFDPSGTDTATGKPFNYNYVWHCHIIDHEDNEMMRPDVIQPNPAAVRTFVKGQLPTNF